MTSELIPRFNDSESNAINDEVLNNPIRYTYGTTVISYESVQYALSAPRTPRTVPYRRLGPNTLISRHSKENVVPLINVPGDTRPRVLRESFDFAFHKESISSQSILSHTATTNMSDKKTIVTKKSTGKKKKKSCSGVQDNLCNIDSGSPAVAKNSFECNVSNRAHSTPVSANCRPRVRFSQSSLKQAENCSKSQKVIETVQDCVRSFSKHSLKWSRIKREAAEHITGIISYKLDSHGQVVRLVSFEVVSHMTGLGSVIKDMAVLSQELENLIQRLSNLGFTRAEMETMKPFKSMSLLRIFELLKILSASFKSDYKYRYSACKDLTTASSSDTPLEICADILNNISSRWAVEPFFEKRDAYLTALIEETDCNRAR